MSKDNADSVVIQNKNWLDKLAPYKQISWKKSTYQLINSFVPFLGLWYLSYQLLSYSYLLSLAVSLLNAGFAARLFLILHDCCHGTFYKSKKLRNIVGFICGVVTLTPYYHWQKIHLNHHACSSNLNRRDIGDFPLMTVQEYKNGTEKQKKNYRFMRSAYTIFLLVPFLLFFVLQRLPVKNIPNFSKKDSQSVLWTNITILSVVLLISYLVGFKNFFLVQFPTSLFVSTIGVWMFFVQHNFEKTYWDEKENLSFYQAAMKGSSYLDFPFLLKWFTADVSYHHIHHLSPSIPNYNLKKCHNENPEFQDVPTLGFFEALKAPSYKLWDEESKKLITFEEFKLKTL